jgi:NAD+ synthase
MRERQRQIIAELGVKPEIDPSFEIEQRTRFLADALARSGMNGFALGISGGQDSLLAGLLAQDAVRQLREQGKDVAFHALLLPYGDQADRADALLAVQTIAPDNVHDYNINLGVDGMTEGFATTEGYNVSDFTKGNIKARIRMTAQYMYANQLGLMVPGTDHAAEAVMGFFTKYGDGGADILPLSGLNKRQGKQLLQELGAPEIFTTKTPTADLLDAKPGQADETEFGVTYTEIDDYLEGLEVDDRPATIIEAAHEKTRHKRKLPLAFTDL